MCSPDDYAHILANEPSPEERAAMAAIPQEPERRPRDVSGEPREWTPNLYDARMAMDPCTRCGQRGHHVSWHETPAETNARIEREQRPAILVAADALGLDDCPMGCSCRGGAL